MSESSGITELERAVVVAALALYDFYSDPFTGGSHERQLLEDAQDEALHNLVMERKLHE